MKFGRQLREYRLSGGRPETLRVFAKARGLDAGNLSRIERGIVLPSPGHARELQEIYGVGDPEWEEMMDAYLQEKLHEIRQVLE